MPIHPLLVNHNRIQQSLPPHALHHAPFRHHSLQLPPKKLSQPRRPLHQPFLAHQFQRANCHRRAERIAAVRRAVRARLDREHDPARRQHARDGVHAAGDGLAEQDHVRLDAAPLVAQQLAGAGDAGLDLVADEQDVVLLAQLLHFAQVAVRRHDDACFALDRLDDEGGCARAVCFESCGEARRVVEEDFLARSRTDGAEVGDEGAVVDARLGVGRHCDGGELA